MQLVLPCSCSTATPRAPQPRQHQLNAENREITRRGGGRAGRAGEWQGQMCRRLQQRQGPQPMLAIPGRGQASPPHARGWRPWCTCQPASLVTRDGSSMRLWRLTCSSATNPFIKSPMQEAAPPAAAASVAEPDSAPACASCGGHSSARAASHSIRMMLRSGRTMRMRALESNVSTATRLSRAEPLQRASQHCNSSRRSSARVETCRPRRGRAQRQQWTPASRR